MDLRHVLAAFHRWRVVMTVLFLLSLGTAGIFAALSPRTYASNTTVFFSLNRSASASTLAQGSTYTQNAVKTYSQVVTLSLVLEPVIRTLNLELTSNELAQHISVQTQPDTVLATITASADSAALATRIANAVSVQLGTAVLSLSPGGPDSPGAVRVTQVSAASTPRLPESPNIPVVFGLGVMAGLFLAVAAAVLLDLLTSPLVDDERVEARSPIIGKIVRDKRTRTHPLPILSHPTQARAESFRSLRTNLRHLQKTDAARCVVVTSALAREGRTGIAVNLALTIAQSHRRVLLIDADLRHPAVAKRLGLGTGHGLSDILLGEQRMEDVIRSMSAETWKDKTVLHVLDAGQQVPDPGELFARTEMTEMLDEARKRYDWVIIDTPPLLPVTDAALLAGQSESTLLVVNARSTTVRDFEESQTALRLAGARVHGVVVNAVRGRRHLGLGLQLFGRRDHV
jgi:capsular exopolysaccharide synthesis family protein